MFQLVKNDGDFLVRESQGSPGQYVLTGVQQNSRKHLLLIDPEGVVSIQTFMLLIFIFHIVTRLCFIGKNKGSSF